MDSSYIFTTEESFRETLMLFKSAIKIDKEDLEHYKTTSYKKAKQLEKWDFKIKTYKQAYNDLELLFNRAITIDHERSTYLKQINSLKHDVKRLNAYLNILSVTKRIEVEEQVKFKTELQINKLCKQAQDELQEQLNLATETQFLEKIYHEGRVEK